MRRAALRAAAASGDHLQGKSPRHRVKAMDTMTFEPDMFGAPKSTYTATKRLGNDQSRLSQIVDGKRKVVSDYVAP